MNEIDDVCRDTVTQVDGGLFCGVVEIGSCFILGAFVDPRQGAGKDEVKLASVAALLGSPAVKRLGDLVKSRTGTNLGPSGGFEEIHVSGSCQLFARVLPGGNTAVVLATKTTTPRGWGWLHLRSAARLLEGAVP